MAETTSDAEPRTGARQAPSVGVSLALVAAGGCAGTLVRAALERAWPTAPGHLPTTTLAINLVGALALGLLLGVLGERRPHLRLALGTGVLAQLLKWQTVRVLPSRARNRTRTWFRSRTRAPPQPLRLAIWKPFLL